MTGSFTRSVDLGRHHLESVEQSQDAFVANLCFGCNARPPRVEAVSSQFGGHAASDTVGYFIPLDGFQQNLFTAYVTDDDGAGDIVEVRYVLRDRDNRLIAQDIDRDPSDGWSWNFDVVKLDWWRSPARLEVEAVDRTGLKNSSSKFIKFFDNVPAWLRKLHDKGILNTSFVIGDTAYVLKVNLADRDLWRRDFSLRILGTLENRFHAVPHAISANPSR